MNVNKELVNGVIDAIIKFVGACSNDVCTDAENEYVIFAGSIKSDEKGNIKTYSDKGDLVAQVPLRPILANLGVLGHNIVDLVEDCETQNAAKAAEAAKAEAEAAEKENQEIDNKIADLESEISSLELRKKPVVRHFVKRF